MQIEKSTNTILKSQNFAETACSIDAQDARYIARLLRDNYSDPRWASVREIIANAVDACKEAGNGKIPLVKVPTKFDPEFAVRDFGAGLTREQVIGNPDLNPVELAQACADDPLFGLYSKYGKSTKRDTNAGIGGFGIGRFAPLSYGDSFTVESFVNGTRSIYVMRIDEYDDTRISELATEPTKEPNGIRIKMAVKQEDVERFAQLVRRLNFFGVEFDVGGMEMPDWSKKAPVTLQDKGWKMVNMGEVAHLLGYGQANGYRYYSRASHYVTMGGVSYPLDLNNLSGGKAKDFIESLSSHSMILELPIGSVKLHHSREALEYNDNTKSVLNGALQAVHANIQRLMQEGIKSCKSFSEAVEKFTDYESAVGRNSFNFDLKWNGNALSRYWKIGAEWDSKTQTHEWEIDVWRYTKNDDNVNGLSLSKSCSPQGEYKSNHAVLYDDMDANAKGKNMVRKVKYLIDKQNMTIVYVVRFEKGSRTKLLAKMKENHFDDLEKSGNFFYLSKAKEVAPIKRQASGSGKNSGSSIKGITIFNKGYRYSLHSAWKRNLTVADVPAGKKYYVPNHSSYVVGTNGQEIHPYQLDKETVMKFLGLPEKTTLFGLTKTAVERIAKSKEAKDWVDIRPLMEKKVEVFVKAHPEVQATSTVSFDSSLSAPHGFLRKFSNHAKLAPELQKAFADIQSKMDIIRKQQQTSQESRSMLEQACKGLGIDPDLKKGKNTVLGQTESAKFFDLCNTYLPFCAFHDGYYGDNQNTRIIRCLSDSTSAHKLDAAVRIANAIYFQEKSGQAVKSA